MAKPNKPDSVIIIKTSVQYGEKSIDALIKLDASDIINLINNRGPIIANKAIQDITASLYKNTNENIKEAINDYL